MGKLRLREADIVLAEQLGADAHDDRHSMTAIETARDVRSGLTCNDI